MNKHREDLMQLNLDTNTILVKLNRIELKFVLLKLNNVQISTILRASLFYAT